MMTISRLAKIRFKVARESVDQSDIVYLLETINEYGRELQQRTNENVALEAENQRLRDENAKLRAFVDKIIDIAENLVGISLIKSVLQPILQDARQLLSELDAGKETK